MLDIRMWSMAITLAALVLSGFTLWVKQAHADVQARSQLSSSDTPTRELNEMPPPSVMVPLELYASLRPDVERGYLTIKQAKDMVRIELASFDSGSDECRPESASILNRVGSVLKMDTRWRATLSGHADSQEIKPPLQKRFPTNQELSEARAESGAKILKQAGVDLRKVSIVGKGESQPVASNATEEGRKKNRRIELLVSAR